MNNTGKGSKTRELPVGRKAIEALQRWLKIRGNYVKASDEKALFIGKTGRRLSHRSIQSRLNRLLKAQALGMHISPHVLRHSFASHAGYSIAR